MMKKSISLLFAAFLFQVSFLMPLNASEQIKDTSFRKAFLPLLIRKDACISIIQEDKIYFSTDSISYLGNQFKIHSEHGATFYFQDLNYDELGYFILKSDLYEKCFGNFFNILEQLSISNLLAGKSRSESLHEAEEHKRNVMREIIKGGIESGAAVGAAGLGQPVPAIVEGGMAIDSFMEAYKEYKKFNECLENL